MSKPDQLLSDLIVVLEEDHKRAVVEADRAWSRVCSLEHQLDEANKHYTATSQAKRDAESALVKATEIAALVEVTPLRHSV